MTDWLDHAVGLIRDPEIDDWEFVGIHATDGVMVQFSHLDTVWVWYNWDGIQVSRVPPATRKHNLGSNHNPGTDISQPPSPPPAAGGSVINGTNARITFIANSSGASAAMAALQADVDVIAAHLARQRGRN